MKGRDTGLDRAVEDFLAHVGAQGRSARTDEYYRAVLTATFLPWCRSEGLTEPAQLDQAALDRFNSHLLRVVSGRTGKPLAKASVASYLRAVHRFLGWSGKAGLTAGTINVQSVRIPRKVLDTLSRSEIAELEAAADSERDKIIIRLLGDSGIRLGELLALKPASLTVQGRDHYLTVAGKGSRQRLVPIKPALAARLKAYAERGRPADAYTEKTFISRRRRPGGSYEALAPRAIQTMLKAVAAKAGIRKPVNPHSFRHSMATNALRGGFNPIALAQTLGHSDLTMLQRTYSHLVVADLSREMMRVLASEDS